MISPHARALQLKLVAVAVNDGKKSRPELEKAGVRVTTDARSLVSDPTIDVVIEVIGGIEPARSSFSMRSILESQ